MGKIAHVIGLLLPKEVVVFSYFLVSHKGTIWANKSWELFIHKKQIIAL